MSTDFPYSGKGFQTKSEDKQGISHGCFLLKALNSQKFQNQIEHLFLYIMVTIHFPFK